MESESRRHGLHCADVRRIHAAHHVGRSVEAVVKRIPNLREARGRLQWAGKRARLHLVRLGKWRPGHGDPTNADLSGAATLIKVRGKRGILTAAHNIRCKFPGGKGAHKGETMAVVFGKHQRTQVIWKDVDLTNAIVEGGTHTGGEPDDMGPDIAWIPLDPELASFFELNGKVFFDWRDNRFPITSNQTKTNDGRGIAVCHLITGYSGEREKFASAVSGPYIVEVAQDVCFPERTWETDEWDYEERVLESGGEGEGDEVVFDDNVPRTVREVIPLRVDRVGGLSGGGLWRFGGDEHDRYFDLAGVVWYQRWRADDGTLRVVNHGRDSIRRIITSGTGSS